MVAAAQRGMYMEIVILDFGMLADVNAANEPFPIIGRIVPELKDGIWSWREEPSSEFWKKQ